MAAQNGVERVDLSGYSIIFTDSQKSIRVERLENSLLGRKGEVVYMDKYPDDVSTYFSVKDTLKDLVKKQSKMAVETYMQLMLSNVEC